MKNTEYKAAAGDQSAEFKGVVEAITGQLEELAALGAENKTRTEAVRLQLEELRSLHDRAAAAAARGGRDSFAGGDEEGWKTPGAKMRIFLESQRESAEAEFRDDRIREMLRSKGNIRVLTGNFLPTVSERAGLALKAFETKTAITSGAVGSATPGILTGQRLDYVPAAQRRLTMRDIIPSRPMEAGNSADFPRENVFTNAASPQVEAAAKDESALTFTMESAPVRTLAHWIPASNQVLDDWSQLGRIIDSKLMYGLKLKEEDEILSGSGTGQHLDGLITQATAYAGTYDQGGDTRLDKLRHALLELEDLDELPDFIAIHSRTWHDIELIKDQASNVGQYVVGDPLGGVLAAPTLWGRKLIVTNSITADGFLVGDSQQAEIADRMEATIMISNSHADYFVRNMVAIRAEERLALAVYRPSAFVYGSF